MLKCTAGEMQLMRIATSLACLLLLSVLQMSCGWEHCCTLLLKYLRRNSPHQREMIFVFQVIILLNISMAICLLVLKRDTAAIAGTQRVNGHISLHKNHALEHNFVQYLGILAMFLSTNNTNAHNTTTLLNTKITKKKIQLLS